MPDYASQIWLKAARKAEIKANLKTATRHSFCTDLRESDIDADMQRICMRQQKYEINPRIWSSEHGTQKKEHGQGT